MKNESLDKKKKDLEHAVMKKNFLLDLEEIYNKNFRDSYRGIITIFSLLAFKFLSKVPRMKFIKNNGCIPINYVKKNMAIKAKPIIKNIYEYEENINDKYKIDLKFKHIPELNFSEKFTKYINDNFFKISNLSSQTSIEKEEYIVTKLAGIEYLNKEGLHIVNKILNNKNYTIYLKLNNLQYNDTVELNSWIFLQHKLFRHKINLNVLLLKNGYGKYTNVRTNEVYDEKIFYYLCDLIDAEKFAKINNFGMWRSDSGKIVKEYSDKKNIFRKIKNFVNEPKWHKVILNKTN